MMKVKRGDIVYIKNSILAENHIQGGFRPYLVVSNDVGNYHSTICIVVPLTTAERKKNLPTHVRVNYHNSLCLCEQMFTIPQDSIREVRFHLDNKEMEDVNYCLKISLELCRW